MRNSNSIVCICLLLCVCALNCDGGYIQKRPSGCYYSRRQCEAKCCCSGKRCEPTTFRGRTYYKCVTVDCGHLSDPTNGYVIPLSGTTFENQAEYRCNDGYVLSYPASRTCLSSGLWSAMAPTCEPEPICMEEECPMLEPPCNGQLLDQPINPKPGDVVTYDCLMGFELIGEKTRTCQEDYTWDGKSPCCVWNPCLNKTGYGDRFEGSTYRIIESPRGTWSKAKGICEADSAHLVEINSEAEQLHLESILKIVDHQWWTNGYKGGGDDVWMWPIDRGDFSPGSSDAYSNWLPGEPSQTTGCVYLDGSDFKWRRSYCSKGYQFVCECTFISDF